jgi:signal transduction histidine kinase
MLALGSLDDGHGQRYQSGTPRSPVYLLPLPWYTAKSREPRFGAPARWCFRLSLNLEGPLTIERVKRRGFDRHSLEWKLPAAISAMLLIVLGTFLATAYFNVRRSAQEAATERLQTVTRQLAEIMQAEASRAVIALRGVASHSAVRSYLMSPDSANGALAMAVLLPKSRPHRFAAMELWGADGRRVMSVGPDTAAVNNEGLQALGGGRDSGTVGPFLTAGDSVVLPVIVPVMNPDDRHRLGYLVEWRYVLTSPEERKAMLELIGPESELILGSPATGIWTNRSSMVAPPPVPIEQVTAGVTTYRRDSLGLRLAMAAPVQGTPWVLLIEFSERGVLGPALRFLTRSGLIATVLFLGGLFGVWLVVRRMTIPLGELTHVSEAISGGDYSGRVRVKRTDELGRLGAAFNTMAERIEVTHRRLEDKVAELRSTQQQFAHAQRMEAVGRLAGGVAHDFNNLLTVILGETELALATGGANDESSLLEIRRAGERAAVLTRQLLAFSRHQLIEPITFSVNDLVADLEKMLARLIGEDVQLITRPSADVPTIRADRGQIEQVLVNLVVNARDAMPHGGRITIETTTIRLDPEYAQSRTDVAPGDYVLISVSDTGHGMSSEVQSHLFEPFYTTKDRSKGTGLGLATSYGIVKQSGGHIAAYSEPGVGTTMRIFLPRVSQEPEPRVKLENALPKGTETILLVEDELAVRQTTSRILAGLGYRVLEAGDADDALKQLNGQHDQVHLMLTDVVLPGIGGRELADQVSVLRPEIRILFASGYTDDVILQHRLVERDVTLLQKPFNAGTLAIKVREVLDRM